MCVLHKNNITGVHASKLWWCLALGVLLFSISCKQVNGDEKIQEKPTPTSSNEVAITVKGDEGVTVNKLNTIKIKKSSVWKEIKQKAVEKIKTKENKEIKE